MSESSCCAPSAHSGHGESCSSHQHRGGPGQVLSKEAREGSTRGMRLLDGGAFLMGAEDEVGFPADGEGPVRQVTLRPFYLDATSVTNEMYARFVDATGYVTESEQFGWTFVFQLHVPKIHYKRGIAREVPGLQWWRAVLGAYWRKPEGPGSSLRGRMDHPVVHITWNDALAYCRWAGKRLPTEAEWEYAARGGLVQKRYVWGDELTPGGKHMCNIWQGRFPTEDSGEDGHRGTAPVRAFPANGYGLYGMAGNAWEWCADWFSPDWHVEGLRENPRGPETGTARVMRGGSFLCHRSYCNRYRVAARTSNTPESSSANLGFRCVRDV